MTTKKNYKNESGDNEGEGYKQTTDPGILSTSNSTPSLANTNISLTKGTGMPFGNNWGLRAIFSFFSTSKTQSNLKRQPFTFLNKYSEKPLSSTAGPTPLFAARTFWAVREKRRVDVIF